MLSLRDRISKNYFGNDPVLRQKELKRLEAKSKQERLAEIIREAKHSATTHVLSKKQLGFSVKKILISKR